MDVQETFFFLNTSRSAYGIEETYSYLYNGDLKNEEKPHVVFLKVILRKAYKKNIKIKGS